MDKKDLLPISDWLAKIKEDAIRKEALECYAVHAEKQKVTGISDAIFFGFTWSSTPQGYTYWLNVHNKYLSNG